MLMRVDLPAPFSPMIARRSPELIVKETSTTARTAPNDLLTLATRSTGWSSRAVTIMTGPPHDMSCRNPDCERRDAAQLRV
jgi:hypothetical protein